VNVNYGEDMYPIVTINKKAAKNLINGGPWVYSEDVTGSEPHENGGVVCVRGADGHVLGLGFINDASKIRLRLLTRRANQVVGRAFLRSRLEDCVEYRKRVADVTSGSSACRLVFGEADFLPGLTVDKFGGVLVAQFLALGLEPFRDIIVEELLDILRGEGAEIAGVYERSDARVRLLEGLEPRAGFIGPAFDTTVRIAENGVNFWVDVANGQKTGFFLDQKHNRAAIRGFCKGRGVLDCFAYTGSFAINAAFCGAASVTALDCSDEALQMARRNAALNALPIDIEFVRGDAFELLPEWARERRAFDVVILDPPAFTKSRASVNAAAHGYRDINAKAIRLTARGGFLATCSCSRFMTPELFYNVVRQAAQSCGRTLRLVEMRQQAPDHPILPGADETHYLKFYIYQVL